MNETSFRVLEDVVLSDWSFQPFHRRQVSNGDGVNIGVVGADSVQVTEKQMAVGTPLTLETYCK